MFLTNLLPGLRDIRTPLATGYLWLVILYLAFFNAVPSQKDATNIAADLYQLNGMVGRPATLAATTFIAYVAGALTQFEPDRSGAGFTRARDWFRRHAQWFRGVPSLSWQPTPEAMSTLDLVVRAEMDAGGVIRPPSEDSDGDPSIEEALLEANHWYEHEVGDTTRAVLEELPQLVIRLQKQNESMYEEYQRLHAEGTFRLNIALPLPFLIGAVVWRTTSFYYLLALLIPMVLVYQGNFRIQGAKDIVIQAVQMREIHPDAFIGYRDKATESAK